MSLSNQCLNAKTTLSVAQSSFNIACPTLAQQNANGAIIASNESYVRQKTEELQTAQDIFARYISIVRRFAELTQPTTAYKAKLDQELEAMDRTTSRLAQSERTYRRKVLDEYPQSGVVGLPGLRTYDDKVLAAFWITYGIVLVCASLLGLKFYGAGISVSQAIAIVVISLLVGYGFAYSILYTFG